MPVMTAAAGSAIGYFFKLMESMQIAAIDLGLSKDVVKSVIVQTALGAAKVALESPKSFAELSASVKSPNGTTEQAFKVFDEKHFDEMVQLAMQAVVKRSQEIAIDICNS